MNYSPNMNDPRIQRRVKKAIGFTNACVSSKPRTWSTRYIDKFFGQQQTDLSMWLRSKLLICTDERYSKEKHVSKKYIKNTAGLNEVVSLLREVQSIPLCITSRDDKNSGSSIISVSQVTKDFLKEEFDEELTAKEFKYEEKSSRLWHNLQRVRRKYKEEIFSDYGFKFNYDIQCCAPTLIYQYSKMIPEVIIDNKYVQGPMDLHLVALTKYLKDRNSVREQLAKEAEITYDQAKEIINALLMGARLGHNEDSDIYKMLNGDRVRIEYLKQNEFLQELRSDLKTCWEYIKPTLPVTYITDKNSRKRKLPISSKQKSMVYFDLERKVLNAIRSFMDQNEIKYFLEHDGWVSDKEIDIDQLCLWVKNSTGFSIQIDKKDFDKRSPITYPCV